MYQRSVRIGSLNHKLTVIDINQYLWCNVRSPFQVTSDSLRLSYVLLASEQAIHLRSHEQVFRNQSFGSSVDYDRFLQQLVDSRC